MDPEWKVVRKEQIVNARGMVEVTVGRFISPEGDPGIGLWTLEVYRPDADVRMRHLCHSEAEVESRLASPQALWTLLQGIAENGSEPGELDLGDLFA